MEKNRIMKSLKIVLIMFAAMLIVSATAPAAVVVSHPGPETYDGTPGDETDLQALYGSVDIGSEGSISFDYQSSECMRSRRRMINYTINGCVIRMSP